MTDKNKASAAVQINRDWLKFFGKHMSITKPFLIRVANAIMIASVGFSAYMIYYLKK